MFIAAGMLFFALVIVPYSTVGINEQGCPVAKPVGGIGCNASRCVVESHLKQEEVLLNLHQNEIEFYVSMRNL